jgi:hypothetical protein
MGENLWLLFFGIFLAETVKNIAKGSANSLQQNIGSFLQQEFIALNLNSDETSEEIQRKLDAEPEIKEQIRRKIEENPNLLNQLTEALRKQEGRLINTKTYIENAGDITINQ